MPKLREKDECGWVSMMVGAAAAVKKNDDGDEFWKKKNNCTIRDRTSEKREKNGPEHQPQKTLRKRLEYIFFNFQSVTPPQFNIIYF